MAQKENAINLAIQMDDSMSHEKAAAHKSDSNQQRTDRQHALKKTADTSSSAKPYWKDSGKTYYIREILGSFQ